MNLFSEAIQLFTGEHVIEQNLIHPVNYRGYIKEVSGLVNYVSLRAVGGEFTTLRIKSTNHLYKSKRIPRCRVLKAETGISMSEFSTSCDDRGPPHYYLVFYVPFPGNSFITSDHSQARIFRLLHINEMGIKPKRIKGIGESLKVTNSLSTILHLCGTTRWLGRSIARIRFESYIFPVHTFRHVSIVRSSLSLTVPRRLVVDYLNKLKIKHNMTPRVFVGNETDTVEFTRIQTFLINWSNGWISDMENCDAFPFANMCSSPNRPIELNPDEPYEGLFDLKDDISRQKKWVLRRDQLAVSLVVLGDHYSQKLSKCVH